MAAADTLEPRWTLSKVSAAFVAIAVHLLTLALLVGGAVLVVIGASHGNPFAIVAGVFMVAAAWFMRPRLGRKPADDVLARDDAPELYALVDEVARALDARTADVVVVDDDFNASWSLVGFRRRRILHLGLPLFNVLDADEQVALIAHELAHESNGDARRGLITGSSIRALSELYALIAPGPHPQNTGMGALDLLVAGVLWVLSRPAAALLTLQAHLLWLDSRRAEFLADARAATVAGTQAVIRLHEQLLLESTIDAVVRHASVHGNQTAIDSTPLTLRSASALPYSNSEPSNVPRSASHPNARTASKPSSRRAAETSPRASSSDTRPRSTTSAAPRLYERRLVVKCGAGPAG
jgi:Zn-dependent protease with chaperone function